MIKNSLLAVALLLGAGASLAVLASARSGAGGDTPLQGVVEFEERVLGFELPGRITTVSVKRGDVVGRGAALAALDDSIEAATRAVRTGEASAAQAEVELLQAGARTEDVRSMAARVRAAAATEQMLRKNLERERALASRAVTPQAVVDDLQSQLDRAVAERQALEQNLGALRKGARSQEVQGAEARALAARSVVDLANVRLSRHELVATHAGSVLDVHVEAGEVIAAGTPVVTLADTKRPYVEVFVPQTQLGTVRLGARASVRIDALNDALAGTVEHIGRRTEFTPRYLFSARERANLVVRVRIRIDDPRERVYAGVPAFVTLEPARP
jgi:HlyD family secretion protein